MSNGGEAYLARYVRAIEEEELLLRATRDGDAGAVESLLRAGVGVNADVCRHRRMFGSEENWTPLHWAAARGRTDIARVLIRYGASVDSLDKYDITPVHLAAEAGHADCLQLLIENDASVNQTTLYKLPQWGVTKDYPYRGGTVALHLATRNNHLKCMEVLFEAGADYNATDEDGRTSLYIAAEKGLESAVRIHFGNSYGKTLLSMPLRDTDDTPLHQCVLHSMQSAVRELLEHGSDVNFLNRAGYSPLHLALQTALQPTSVNIIRDMVKHGYRVDLNREDIHGMVPLEYVCFMGSKLGRIPNLSTLFIAYGAKFVHLICKKKTTLLEQELQECVSDWLILYAIVKSLARLPLPEKLCAADMHILSATRPAIHNSEYWNHVAKRNWYSRIASSVRTLQHLCRVAIRNQMGPRRLNLVNRLMIPKRLQKYLLLKTDDYL